VFPGILFASKWVMAGVSSYGMIGCILLGFWMRSLDDKLLNVLKNGTWRWREARSDDLVTIHSHLPLVEIGERDQVVWSLSKKGIYSCADTWDYIWFKCQKVSWWRIIWFPFATPKHAFILWLADRDRLSTGDTLCMFCRVVLRGGIISYFSAASAAGCGGSFRRPCFGLEDVISWGESRETELKGSSLRYSICKLSVGIL
jgi:hypothetical protein